MAIRTRPIEDLFPLVTPYVSSCPIPMIEQAIRLAAIEFCERTRCWRYITTKRIVAQDAVLVTPPYAVIFEIETATFNDSYLEPVQFSDVQLELNDDWTGDPKYITQSGPGTVTVIPFAQGTLHLTLFLKPKAVEDSISESPYAPDPDDVVINVLPEFLLLQHGEAIAAGALQRIHTLPGQPYSDPARAADAAVRFNRAADSHFARNLRGQHRAPSRTRPDYF